jgi:hypothetical protein
MSLFEGCGHANREPKGLGNKFVFGGLAEGDSGSVMGNSICTISEHNTQVQNWLRGEALRVARALDSSTTFCDRGGLGGLVEALSSARAFPGFAES